MKLNQSTLVPIVLVLSLGLGFKAWTAGSEKKGELEMIASQLEAAKSAHATAQEAAVAIGLIPNESGHLLSLNAAASDMLLKLHRRAILNGVNIISISNAKSAENELTLQNATTPLPMSAGLLVATPFSIKINYTSYAGLKTFLLGLSEQNLKISNLKLSGVTASLEVSLLSKSTLQLNS
ncbi:MAG: hypothetical protein NTX38_19585 [Methylobacter sp.]|nr:hypothetical protein [Methylobacter sp.]